MKSKRLLRFYFGAEGLEGALDNLILKRALGSAGRDGEGCAEEILALISAKDSLAGLWGYLDKVIKGLGGEVEATLFKYASMRTGLSLSDGEEVKRIKRCLMKFTRRARAIGSFSEGVKLVNFYYALIR